MSLAIFALSSWFAPGLWSCPGDAPGSANADSVWARLACPAAVYLVAGYFPLALLLSLYWRSLCIATSNYVILATILVGLFVLGSIAPLLRAPKTRILLVLALLLVLANVAFFRQAVGLSRYNTRVAAAGLAPRVELLDGLATLEAVDAVGGSAGRGGVRGKSNGSGSGNGSGTNGSAGTSDQTTGDSEGAGADADASPGAGSQSGWWGSARALFSRAPAPLPPYVHFAGGLGPKFAAEAQAADEDILTLAQSVFGNFAVCCDAAVLRAQSFSEPVASARMAWWNGLGTLFLSAAVAVSYIILTLDDHFVFDYLAAFTAGVLARALPSKFERLPLQYPYPATGLTAAAYPAAMHTRSSVDD